MFPDSTELLQRLELNRRLELHSGCVNTVAWNQSGSLLLSGSDDHRLVLTNPYTGAKVHEVLTPHRANIFAAKFLPATGDNKIVSCAGDGTLLYTDILREAETASCQFNCHAGTVYDTITIPGDPNTFLSCGEDGTVRWFDLRTKSSCLRDVCKEDILINTNKAVTAISLNPMLSYQIAVGCSDSKVRIFDRRQLGTQATGHTPDNPGLHGLVSRFSVPEFGEKMRRLTCVQWRPDGREVLASYSSDYIYIFDPASDCEDGGKKLKVGNPVRKASRRRNKSPKPFKKLRLRGDWSDTGPHSRPEVEARHGRGERPEAREEERPTSGTAETERDRENYQISLMQRMTDALSRMLNDPSTRLAMQRLNTQGEGAELTNREPRLESGELGAGPSQGQQSRAAVAIQDRWRRYRQRRQEEAGVGQAAEEEEVIVTEAEAEDEQRRCSPTQALFCCPQQKVEPDHQKAANEDTQIEDCPDSDQTTNACSDEKSNDNTSTQTFNHTDSNSDDTKNTQADSNDCDDDNDVNINELRTSVASLRSSGVEPEVQLRYTDQGTGSGQLTVRRPDPGLETLPGVPELTEDTEVTLETLPGPSRVVTGHGQPRFDPATGVRRRRSGISSVPTSSILPEPSTASARGQEVMEYETSDESDEDGEEGDMEAEDRVIRQPRILQQLTGHRNARTMIKEAAWWGTRFIMSGSDCGHLFAWDRETGELVMMLEADRHVVNCVQPHPHDPILATSGIDYDVKLWGPTAEAGKFDRKAAEVVMRRNEVMLEETRDTITVPASLMIRMLASLNQIRRGEP